MRDFTVLLSFTRYLCHQIILDISGNPHLYCEIETTRSKISIVNITSSCDDFHGRNRHHLNLFHVHHSFNHHIPPSPVLPEPHSKKDKPIILTLLQLHPKTPSTPRHNQLRKPQPIPILPMPLALANSHIRALFRMQSQTISAAFEARVEIFVRERCVCFVVRVERADAGKGGRAGAWICLGV